MDDARHSAFNTAPIQDIIDISLRQFRRPLANYDIDLSASDITDIATTVAERQPLTEKALQVRDGLVRAVAESETVLAGWELTFAQALRTPMDNMPGWETTGEFLALANEKSNAELRIAAGSVLVLALGDARYREHIMLLLNHPELDDVSAIMARRVLEFVSGKADAAARQWLQDQA